MFKRLLQTQGPYKITSNMKKYCVNAINKIYMSILSTSRINKLYRNRIKPIDIDISICML